MSPKPFRASLKPNQNMQKRFPELVGHIGTDGDLSSQSGWYWIIFETDRPITQARAKKIAAAYAPGSQLGKVLDFNGLYQVRAKQPKASGTKRNPSTTKTLAQARKRAKDKLRTLPNGSVAMVGMWIDSGRYEAKVGGGMNWQHKMFMPLEQIIRTPGGTKTVKIDRRKSKPNPLKQGYSQASISENISQLMDEGYPQKQAIAIAYRVARKAAKRAGKTKRVRELKQNPPVKRFGDLVVVRRDGSVKPRPKARITQAEADRLAAQIARRAGRNPATLRQAVIANRYGV